VPIPKVGDMAPDFEAASDEGKSVSLKALRGRKVALYAYPRDETPGCTVEACGIRDDYQALMAAGVVVLGVSPDSVESHRKFKENHKLPFALLADEDYKVAEAYGVVSMKGDRKRIHRTTFLIGPDGTITNVFENVNPQGHSKEILAAFSDSAGGPPATS